MRTTGGTLGAAVKTSVGAASVNIAAADPTRLGVFVQADKANSGTIYLSGATATTDGFGELEPGDSVYLPVKSDVFAIASAASQNVRTLPVVL